jgi:3-hydroxyisobutyrate dehydrogenase-like beta-hydroxyacid dehydrogenase
LIKTHDMDTEDAELYAEGVRRGDTLVTALVNDSQVSSVRDILNRYSPTDVHTESSTWRSEGWSRFDETAKPYNTSDLETYRRRHSSSTGTPSTTAVGVYPSSTNVNR